VLRRTGAPPELSVPSGNVTSYLATGETTRGAFGLYQWDMGAQPSGPSPHFHRSITESFFVLNGDRAALRRGPVARCGGG